MFVKTSKGEGYPNSTKITCKPNWTCSGPIIPGIPSQIGITTDLNFIEGFLKSVRAKEPQEILSQGMCLSLLMGRIWATQRWLRGITLI